MEEATLQHSQNLDILLSEYKETVKQMEIRISELGGDLTSSGSKRPKKELEEEIEKERVAREAAEAGAYLAQSLQIP